MRCTQGQLCEWLGASCNSVQMKGEDAYAGRPSGFQKGHMTRAGQRAHLTKDVRIGLGKHAATLKKLYAVQVIRTASSINQIYKASSQDKSRGFC